MAVVQAAFNSSATARILAALQEEPGFQTPDGANKDSNKAANKEEMESINAGGASESGCRLRWGAALGHTSGEYVGGGVHASYR